MACSKEYGLTDSEKILMRRCDMEEDIGSETRKMNRRIKNRLANWTKSDRTYAGVNNPSALLFGMGGVGKSALGNLLVGKSGAFSVSNKARAETNAMSSVTGSYGGSNITVYDTPGYLTRKLLEGEASPMEAVKMGMRGMREGIHVFILVINGSNMRNLENEALVIRKANLLNPATFKHAMLVVTHSGTCYSRKSVDDFIRDASQSPEFSTLISKIDRRVVLVELGDGTPLTEQTLDSNPFYSGERDAGRDMVVNMMQKVIINNSSGNFYRKADIERDLGVCFPPLATIFTPQGKKTMEELELNDDVLVVNTQGEAVYEKVIMFSHANPSQGSYFCTISTEDGKVLQLSPGHLLHVGVIGKLVPAQDVKKGHVVFTSEAVEGVCVDPVQVTATSGEWLTGIYCPHTPSGSIIVDGVAASCYTNLMSPTLAHAAMFPVRVAHRLLPADWFRWIVSYNEEQGMPSLALKVTQVMQWS